MNITPAHVGTCVTWDTWCGTVTARVTGLSIWGVSTEATDGVHELHPTSQYIDLDRITRRWRPATPEETAEFDARYRPAPQNWH